MTDDAKKQAEEILGKMGEEEKGESEKGEPTPEPSSSPAPDFSEEELHDANVVLIEAGLDETEMSPEEAIAKAKRIEKLKSRAAQVLSRGRTLDSIQAALARAPGNHVPQLVRNNDIDIARYEALGFRIVTDPDFQKDTAHGKPDNRVVCGDTVVMSIPKEEYAAIDAVRVERKKRNIAASAQTETKHKLEEHGMRTYSH